MNGGTSVIREVPTQVLGYQVWLSSAFLYLQASLVLFLSLAALRCMHPHTYTSMFHCSLQSHTLHPLYLVSPVHTYIAYALFPWPFCYSMYSAPQFPRLSEFALYKAHTVPTHACPLLDLTGPLPSIPQTLCYFSTPFLRHSLLFP